MKRLSFLFCLLLVVLSGCAGPEKEEPLRLRPASFADLDGWTQDQQQELLPAFQQSCSVFAKKDPETSLRGGLAGRYQDWTPLCDELEALSSASPQEARAFFEKNFMPYAVETEEKGLFTGYYRAELKGSRTRMGPYQTPLWQRPKDMLSLDLSAFFPTEKRKITGKVEGSAFVPYDQRARVAAGSLEGRAEPLVWVDDPIGAFFLEVQGSGQIALTDGSVMHVGYDAQNGHGYTAIGRVMADKGLLEKPITMQKIRDWLAQHPGQAQDIMNANPSVVFFKEQKTDGAIGAMGIKLTPMRSLAVDPSFIPLGVPLWLQTPSHKRLVMAQDTGGAIKGAVRGDLFWGAGAAAEAGAGMMQDSGSYYILLPRQVAVP